MAIQPLHDTPGPQHAGRAGARRRRLATRASVVYASALRGGTPAEALTTFDRERLVEQLWRRGWTDIQIAEHTRMTTYTTARIRERLGLEARSA